MTIPNRDTPGAVFIVHGHDEWMRGRVVAQLQMLGLRPIVLQDELNKGRTIIEKLVDIEKLIDTGAVGFAVVLLSPDDMGYSKRDGAGKARPRARQNVVLELGYFIGKIGRDRVLPLVKKEKGFEM